MLKTPTTRAVYDREGTTILLSWQPSACQTCAQQPPALRAYRDWGAEFESGCWLEPFDGWGRQRASNITRSTTSRASGATRGTGMADVGIVVVDDTAGTAADARTSQRERGAHRLDQEVPDRIEGALTGTCAAYLWKVVGLLVLSVLNMGSLHTKPPP